MSTMNNMSLPLPLMAPPVSPKPFIKWAGGKQGLSRQLVSLFPNDFSTFYEPFLGGGSIFLTTQPNHAVLNDMNSWLVDTYLAVRDHWRDLARTLDTLENTKEKFLEIRSIDPYSVDEITRAAYFIYLNKTCFRGLFRVNKKGKFNVPYGAYDRRYYDIENLEAVSWSLQDTVIYNGDFELALFGISGNDFAYFDPPYYKLGGYSDFNRYTKDQFNEGEHLRLAALCRELDTKGVRWAVSNSNTEFVRKIFDGYHFTEISSRREINLNSTNRNVKELFITNYRILA